MNNPCNNCADYDDWQGSCKWCKEHEYCLHTAIEDAILPTPVVTNYDRLISKTPEELAGWISAYSENCDDCRHIRSGDPYVNGGCYSCWLDWLKSPVEVDG